MEGKGGLRDGLVAEGIWKRVDGAARVDDFVADWVLTGAALLDDAEVE